MAQRAPTAWMGFLACAFAVVGMTGLFATFAAPLPLQRAAQREAAFDAAAQSTPGAARETLRPALGEDADAVLAALDGGGGGGADRLPALRDAMRARFAAEAEAIAFRLRLLVVVVTVSGAVFGAALLGLARSG